MKIELNKVTKRINILDYSLQELAVFYEQFDNCTVIIRTSKRYVIFKFKNSSFPHIIGMQYAFNKRNKIKYKGLNGFEKIKDGNITWNNLKKLIIKNHNINVNNIKNRIEYLPMFINTITKNIDLKIINKNNLVRKSNLKGNIGLVKKAVWQNHLIYLFLSLKEIDKNHFIIETFIVENDITLIGLLESEKILNIYMYRPSSNKELQKIN